MINEILPILFNFVGVFLLILGGFFELVGAIGVLRMPDFFTRAHAVTMTVIGGTVAPLVGIALISLADANPEGVYLAIICIISAVIILITAPTGSHMLVRAALKARTRVKENTPGEES